MHGLIGTMNTWEGGYPSGGNYWSDYEGVDAYNGPYQNETGSDGIGDTAYFVGKWVNLARACSSAALNQWDQYPLMAPVSLFDAGTWDGVSYSVYVVSNSTISDLNFNPDNFLISFNVTGPEDTVGFCRITIPDKILWCNDPEQWEVWVNNTLIEDRKVMENINYTYIYFTYNQSTQNVDIIGVNVIPEFPTWTSILPLLTVLTVAITIYKRKLIKTLTEHQ
jgi:hypothetical protein